MNSETSSIKSSTLLEIAQACRVLGALFYWAPKHSNVQPILDSLLTEDFSLHWPLPKTDKSCLAIAQMGNAIRSTPNRTDLDREFQRLFIGPDTLQAPPWGSVYLEEEGTLFGETTQALHKFLLSQGISLNTGQEEPEDHIGLMLWEIALLAEDLRSAALKQFMNQHFNSWVDIYFDRLSAATEDKFYQGLISLTKETLAKINQELALLHNESLC